MRHQPKPEGVAWLRQQDPGQVQRDRKHRAGRHRGQQAEGDHAESGGKDKRVQGGRPGHIRVGDQGPVAKRHGLRQVQRALRLLHKQDFEEQGRQRAAPRKPPKPKLQEQEEPAASGEEKRSDRYQAFDQSKLEFAVQRQRHFRVYFFPGADEGFCAEIRKRFTCSHNEEFESVSVLHSLDSRNT